MDVDGSRGASGGRGQVSPIVTLPSSRSGLGMNSGDISPPRYVYTGGESPMNRGNEGGGGGVGSGEGKAVRLVKKGGRPDVVEFKTPRLVKGGPGVGGGPPRRNRGGEGGGSGFDGYAAGGGDSPLLPGGKEGYERYGGGDNGEGERDDSPKAPRPRSAALKLSKRFSFYRDKGYRSGTPDSLGLLTTTAKQDPESWASAPLGHKEKERRCCSFRRCCCCFCVTLVVLVVVLGIASLTAYLIIKPQAPKFTIKDVNIPSFAIYIDPDYGLSRRRLSSEVNITIESYNPNRVSIVYESLTFRTVYMDKDLGTANGNEVVRQGPRSTVIVLASLNINGTDVTGIEQQLTKDYDNRSLPLVISARVVVRVEFKGFKSPRFQVKVECDVVVSPSTAAGKGAGMISKKCGKYHDLKLV